MHLAKLNKEGALRQRSARRRPFSFISAKCLTGAWLLRIAHIACVHGGILLLVRGLRTGPQNLLMIWP